MRKIYTLIKDQVLGFRHILHCVEALVICEDDQEIRARIFELGRGFTGAQEEDG